MFIRSDFRVEQRCNYNDKYDLDSKLSRRMDNENKSLQTHGQSPDLNGPEGHAPRGRAHSRDNFLSN